MRTSVYHEILAAAAVRDAGLQLEDVASVTVDSVEVSNLAAATQRLQKHESPEGNLVTRGIDQVAGYVASKFSKEKVDPDIRRDLRAMMPAGAVRQKLVDAKDSLKESQAALKAKAVKAWFDGTSTGKTVNRLLLEGDPEAVHYAGHAVVRLNDGTVREVDVQVLDRLRSGMLQRVSLLGQLVGFFVPVPFVDSAIATTIGAAALLGAQASKASGNTAYADALTETAKKNLVLGLFGGVWTAPLMLRDVKDLARLKQETQPTAVSAGGSQPAA